MDVSAGLIVLVVALVIVALFLVTWILACSRTLLEGSRVCASCSRSGASFGSRCTARVSAADSAPLSPPPDAFCTDGRPRAWLTMGETLPPSTIIPSTRDGRVGGGKRFSRGMTINEEIGKSPITRSAVEAATISQSRRFLARSFISSFLGACPGPAHKLHLTGGGRPPRP